ncbi:class I SAM-dependent methyltransferase [Candidatus Woesearchaeota archaeon]|nr:class I SAM-dependent methyltransferase [Candidatus Woesearchaeota archaeon]
MKNISIRRNTCRLCNSGDLELVVPLGNSPVSEKYLTKSNINEEQVKVPLDLYFCNHCSHVQLLDIVDPEFLWSDLTFQTSHNPKLVEHFHDVANRILAFSPIEKKDLIIDIGSNDGTLLQCFKDEGYGNILGIDPSKEISSVANSNGVPTINDFFNKKISSNILKDHGPAKIITANNVYAHIDDLTSITEAIKNVLHDDGIFVFEVSYLLDVVQKSLIGTIFHEHLSYHSVKAMKKFLNNQDLELIHVERGPEQGGSIIGYAQHKSRKREVDNSVNRMLDLEREAKLDQPGTIKKMYKKLEKVKYELKSLIGNYCQDGKVVAGFGAARAGTTLLSYFEIGGQLDFLVDDNESKHYKFSPGDKIEVLPTSEIYNKKPDYVLILAWLHADKIIEQHRKFIEGNGSFIRVFPTVEVISKSV